MKRALILVLLLLSLMPVATSFADERLELVSYTWGTLESPMPVRPGYEDVPLTIMIQNLHSYQVIGIYATLVLEPPFHNRTGGNLVSAAYGPVVPPGAAVPLTFYVDVDEDAVPGLYTLRLNVSYYDSVYSEMETSFNLTLPIEPPKGLKLITAGWGSPSQPMKPVPNDKAVPLFLLILNLDSNPISGVTLELSLPEGFSGPEGERKVNTTIPMIQGGQTAPSTFYLDLDKELEPSKYAFNLSIAYFDFWHVKFTQEETFSLRVYPKPDISLSAEETTVYLGSIAELNLMVRNTGSSKVFDVLPNLQTEGLIPISAPNEPLPELSPLGSANFTFSLYAPTNLPPGPVPMAISVSYKDERGALKSESIITYITTLSRTSTVKLEPSITEILYKRMNEVQLKIVNLSEEPMYDAELTLTPPSSVPLFVKEGVGPWKFSYIGPNEDKVITLHVLPLAQMDSVAVITATLIYKDGQGLTRTHNDALLFRLKGFPDIQLVNWKVSPSPAYNGSKLTISGSLLNQGTQQAYYSRIYLQASPPFIAGQLSDKYIGDLPLNSLTPFSLQLGLGKRAATGTYTVNLVFEYMDVMGNEYRLTWPVSVDVVQATQKVEVGTTPQPSPLNLNTMLTFALAILLILALIWGYRRGKREEVEIS
jgi:hypothetical protein